MPEGLAHLFNDAVGRIAGESYYVFALVMAWSAWKYRRKGWHGGFLFAILMATIPAWVLGMFWLAVTTGLIANPSGQLLP